ncbi:MAG: AI-2E family transporter, partial [Candidatus Levybacteria bacterium]|nr:AI-2E family transporter [Candidatus Levybacteria bacterium]
SRTLRGLFMRLYYTIIGTVILGCMDEIRRNYSLVRVLIILLIIAVGSYVLSLAWNLVFSKFLDLFVILLLSWLLSFTLFPVVVRIQKLLKSSKLIATIITYILISIILILVSIVYFPLVASQILSLTIILPQYLKTSPPVLITFIDSLSRQIGNSVVLIPSVAQFLFSAFITLVISFYFIVDKEKINREIFHIIPEKWHGVLRFTEQVINDTFISFLKVQLFYAISTGVLTWIILRLFNIDFAASVAALAGAFAFVPLIGPFFALIPPVLVALLSDPVKALIIGGILIALQQVIFNMIGPKLLGKAFKLHPVIILLSFLIGLKFAGGLGAVFAIPVLGISAVMIRKFGHYLLEIRDKAAKGIMEQSKKEIK